MLKTPNYKYLELKNFAPLTALIGRTEEEMEVKLRTIVGLDEFRGEVIEKEGHDAGKGGKSGKQTVEQRNPEVEWNKEKG